MVNIPNTKGFIVDGFPRELEQGKEFENEVSWKKYLLGNAVNSVMFSFNL